MWWYGVKPQLIAQVCESQRVGVDFSGKLVLSIAAGVTVSRFYALLGENINIVLVMPNTPCLMGKRMSGLYAHPQTCEENQAFSAQLMVAVGKLYWLEQESDINGVIAAAGSTAAYFFLFMEAMQQQAQALGFDETTARTLVLQIADAGDALVPFCGKRDRNGTPPSRRVRALCSRSCFASSPARCRRRSPAPKRCKNYSDNCRRCGAC